MSCAISQGDLPVTFEWLKDGEVIPMEYGVVTRKYDDYTESLSIESVTSLHSGNFTCIARNRAGADAFTSQLLVRGNPPPWVLIVIKWFLFFQLLQRLYPFILGTFSMKDHLPEWCVACKKEMHLFTSPGCMMVYHWLLITLFQSMKWMDCLAFCPSQAFYQTTRGHTRA